MLFSLLVAAHTWSKDMFMAAWVVLLDDLLSLLVVAACTYVRVVLVLLRIL
jgi:hypothetical protein